MIAACNTADTTHYLIHPLHLLLLHIGFEKARKLFYHSMWRNPKQPGMLGLLTVAEAVIGRSLFGGGV